MRVKCVHKFEDIINIENLLLAWNEFSAGKRAKADVCEFQLRLADNLFSLHRDLANLIYCHGGYHAFKISDPKPRDIHKASVRDRVLHRAVYRKLYPFFDKTFSSSSFSYRNNKGTHKAIKFFRSSILKASKNNTKTCFVLKCDIRKFFASINHRTLLNILAKYIQDRNILWLLEKIISSFESRTGIGLPLGNLTSQLFANIYLNEFDQFVKHKLKAKYYLRYADDFVLLSENKIWLEKQIPFIRNFLREKLRLLLHSKKILIKTAASGVDFLGWVNFPDHRVLRTTTRRRVMKKIKDNPKPETVVSYLGLLSYGNSYKIRKEILEKY